MKNTICVTVTVVALTVLPTVAMATPASKILNNGLTALGAVADIDQLFSNDSSNASNEGSDRGSNTNIGAAIWKQKFNVIGGKFEGSTLTLNQLIAKKSNIALLIGDQVVEIRNSDVTNSSLTTNIVQIKDSNIGYINAEQFTEILRSNVQSDSHLQVNTISVQNSNLIGADIKQIFSMRNTNLTDSKVNANGIAIGRK